MKRTVEIILTVIGGLIGLFMTLVGGLILWMKSNPDEVRHMFSDMPEFQQASIDVEEVIASINQVGASILILALLSVIAGIVAIVLLKGNKNPKAAGIILIVTAIIAIIFTQGFMTIGGIFYVIAGILALVRKPKQPIEASI
ncbi:MAG TPA: DUF4064 domain-containing protein [Candidatus Avamphibacillus intestinigallinarum]|nr:DUF4064 domain-containing protein [Candidatus Avamphibacillus intestinigallinarum]